MPAYARLFSILIPSYRVKEVLKECVEKKFEKEVRGLEWQGKLLTERKSDLQLCKNECFSWLNKWRSYRSEAGRNLVAFPVRMQVLGLINPSDSADVEYSASIRVSTPLASKIEAQSHETPEETEVRRLDNNILKEKDGGLKEELEEVKVLLPDKT